MDTKSVFTKTFGKKKQEPTTTPPAQKKEGRVVAPKKSASTKRQAAAAATFDSENIVRAIHQQKEETQRITVDMPKDIYQQMKVHLAHENVSIRDFIVRLVDVYLTRNNIK